MISGAPPSTTAEGSRSVSRARTTSGRGTIKIRNVTEGVVYHLTFDGDLGRLNGLQLKQHIESIAGIVAAKQLLSLNGHIISNETSGAAVGLRDGVVLVLETGDSQAQAAAPATLQQQVQAVVHDAQGRGTSRTPSQAASQPPAPLHNDTAPTGESGEDLARIEAQLAAIERRRAELLQQHAASEAQYRATSTAPRESSVVHHYHPGYAAADSYHQHHRPAAASTAPTTRQSVARVAPPTYRPSAAPATPVDDTDTDDVEVEVQEETGLRAAWLPQRSVEVEEMRLQQQDYVWKMEQVRFETERMTREREMKRQQQELEYQASLLDRERLELERRTIAERSEFEELQSQDRVDLDIEAHYAPYLLNYYGGNSRLLGSSAVM